MFITFIYVILLRLHNACKKFKKLIKLWWYKLALTLSELLTCSKAYIGAMFCITDSLDVSFRGIEKVHVQRTGIVDLPTSVNIIESIKYLDRMSPLQK